MKSPIIFIVKSTLLFIVFSYVYDGKLVTNVIQALAVVIVYAFHHHFNQYFHSVLRVR